VGNLNTILYLNEEGLRTFRKYADVHIVYNRNEKEEKYKIRLNNGSIIGGIMEVSGKFLVYFLDDYSHRSRFSLDMGNSMDKVISIAQDVKSGKLKNFIEQIPKYHTKPKRRHKNTRIFHPIDISKGEYLEVTYREINGRSISRYRKVNIYCEEPKIRTQRMAA